MSINVLMVGADDVAGGVSNYVANIVRVGDPAKLRFHMTVSGRGTAVSGGAFGSVGRHRFPITYSAASLPGQAVALRRLVKHLKIDVVHAHTTRGGVLACLALLWSHIPIVYTGHGLRYEQKRSRAARSIFFVLERFICASSAIVTFTSKRDKGRALRRKLVAEKTAFYIPTRIDGSRFGSITPRDVQTARRTLGIPDDAVVIGATGRLERRKDPHTFIRAARRISEALPRAYFVWVGDGDLRNELDALAQRLGISHQFIVTGFVEPSAVPKYLKLMDVFLFTSDIENVPLSILEAHGAGCPVVSSAYNGVEELISRSETGYLFPSGDYDEAASIALGVLSDKAKTKQVTDAARAQFREWHADPDRMAKQFEAVYLKLANTHAIKVSHESTRPSPKSLSAH